MQAVLVALQQQLLAAQPIALTPLCEEADIDLEERGQVHLNWLMALVIAGPSKSSSSSSGVPSGCQSGGRGAGCMPVIQLLPSKSFGSWELLFNLQF